MFIDDFYNNYYFKLNCTVHWKKTKNFPNLFQRGNGYKIIFEKLLKLNLNELNIIETGVLKNIGNWSDGQSTWLFQEFIKDHYKTGKIETVDISEENCNIARNFLNKKYVNVICSDSIEWLDSHSKKNINLYHLDSYDVEWKNPHLSAEHHLKEFLTIEKFLEPNTLVMIDDNTFYNGKRTGKGLYIYNYLAEKNIFPIYDNHQLIYNF
jgi:hypothetical protein